MPFWLSFPTEPSAAAIESYLARRDFEEIGQMLFSHGVDSIGLVPLDRWRSVLARAKRKGEFIGVDERAYPRDFAAFARYHTELRRRIAVALPPPPLLTLDDVDRFVAQTDEHYEVVWE